jgi:RNA polymerase sigma-70 factor, ECF subfamily
MSGPWRWRSVLTRANGQPALAFYSWDEDAGAHLPFALNVVSLRGDRVS